MDRWRRLRRRWALMATLALGVAFSASAGMVSADAGPILPMLKEEPLVVWRVQNASAALAAFPETRVGKQVRQSPLLSSMWELRRSALRFGAAVLADFPQETVERLLRGELAFVVFPPSETSGAQPPLALAWFLGDDATMVRDAIEERVIPRLRVANVRLTAEAEGTGESRLLRVSEGERSVYVRVVDGALVVGTASAMGKFGPSSAAPEWFPAEDSAGAVSSVFLNLEPVWAAVRAVGKPGQAERLGVSGIPSVRDIRAGTAMVAGGFKDTIVARIEPDAGGLVGSLVSLEPGASGCASVIPPDYGLVAAWQIESGERLYELIEDVVRRTRGEAGVQQLRQRIDSLDLAFGVNVRRDLMPKIGNEVFLAVRPPDVAALQAGAGLRKGDVARIFGFAVKDGDGVRSIIEHFPASPQARQAGWELATERYRNAEVYTLMNATEQSRLSLALLGGFLVCSERRDWLEDSVRAVADDHALAGDEQYAKVLAQLPSEANALFYVDTRPLRELVLAVARAKGRGEAKAFQPLIEQAVPHLGGYGLTAVFGGDEVRVEAYGDVPAAFLAFNAALFRAAR